MPAVDGRGLLYHVRIGAGRVPAMLADPEPADGPMAPASGYYRRDRRLSSAANIERIIAALAVHGLDLGAGLGRQLPVELALPSRRALFCRAWYGLRLGGRSRRQEHLGGLAVVRPDRIPGAAT
jgi:hypothetical protein